jgi:hypothetical protein
VAERDQEEARRVRAAARRARISIRRAALGDDVDVQAIGGREAIALAAELSRAAWALSGRPFPCYDRAHTPYVFARDLQDG